ncbi:MAG: endonuclease [Synergistaceae bacterium]|nr:endonuclease [Synergistaceae bacterium]
MAVADGQMGIHAREKALVLGLDPGRDKTGFAFTDMDGGLILSGIFPTNEQERFFAAVLSQKNFAEWIIEGSEESLNGRIAFLAVGDGTHSREFTQKVRSALPFEVLSVDEHNTTLEARKLYWKIHRPGVFMRFLPEGLRVPDRVLDDLAAWAIAIRGVKKYRDMRPNKL